MRELKFYFLFYQREIRESKELFEFSKVLQHGRLQAPHFLLHYIADEAMLSFWR